MSKLGIKLSKFWFSTGTPIFIAEIFKKKRISKDYFKPTKLDGEKSIVHGIIDAVLIESDEHVAVIEIKSTESENRSLNSLINESFKQIDEKAYYLPYENSNISLIAIAFKDRPIKMA
jgi:hypothetical protein